MTETPSTPAAHAEAPVDVAPLPVDALFTAKQIALATLVATPLAGALLGASNARVVGKSDALRAVIVITGAAATALIFAVDVWGAGPFTLLALPASALGALVASSIAFARWYPSTRARAHASALVVVVACWVALGVVGAGAVGAAHLRTPSADEALGDHVAHSAREHVSFRDGARREDADDVVRALVAARVFTGSGTLRLDVDRANEPNALRVSLRIPDDATLQDLEAARVMLKNVARHLTPPRCIDARVVSASGVERASGRLCP